MNTMETRTNELREIIRTEKESTRVNRYDFSAANDLKAFQKQTDAVFKGRLERIKSFSDRSKDAPAFTYDYLTRRKNAVCRIASEVQNAFQEKFPRLGVADALLSLSAPCPAKTFRQLNEAYRIELAAALWILDHLRSSDKLEQALAYLPQSREALDGAELPDVTDSVHCDDLIRGMICVIRSRNRGYSGFNADTVFMDDADTRLKANDFSQPPKNRADFDAVMALIDPEEINRLRETYLSHIRTLTENCLSVLARMQDDLQRLSGEKIGMIEAQIEKAGQGANTTDSALSVLSRQAETEATYTASDDEQRDAFKVEEALRHIRSERDDFCLNITLMSLAHRREWGELSALFEAVERPVIDDPYAMCFGFLSLLDADSDALWTCNLPYVVLADACCELPWASSADPALNEAPTVTPEFYEAAKLHPERYITPASQSRLNRPFVNQPFAGALREKISFSQLVCMMTDLIPPRGMPELSYIKSLFRDSHLSDGETELLYEYFTLACAVTQRDENYVFIDEEEPDDSAAEQPQDDAAKKVRELKRENKNLKAMLNKLERRLKESGEALNSANESLNEATSELAELRSMIRKADKTDENYTATVSFPYSAKKRAVVFGGHESWAKAIKPLLPDTRFVEPSALPNTGLILNADVVWIQTNALSHSSFYKIIDVVRKHSIDLCYFKYASAEKCAEQFALYDMEATETEPSAE